MKLIHSTRSVAIPEDVSIEVKARKVRVKGPRGAFFWLEGPGRFFLRCDRRSRPPRARTHPCQPCRGRTLPTSALRAVQCPGGLFTLAGGRHGAAVVWAFGGRPGRDGAGRPTIQSARALVAQKVGARR